MRRPLLLAAALALTASPAHAGSYTFRDTVGDAVTDMAAHDIVAVSYAVTGRGAARELVVTLTLAGPPASDAAVSYAVSTRVGDGRCGSLLVQYLPGSVYGSQVAPGWADGTCVDPKPTVGGVTGYRFVVPTAVRGNAVVWRLRLADTKLDVGVELSEHVARAEAADPATGTLRVGEFTSYLRETAFDTATSYRTWVLR